MSTTPDSGDIATREIDDVRQMQRIAAYALIVDRDLDVLLVRAGPKSATPGRWYLPGGGVDFGESPEECAVREVREETGLAVVVASSPLVLSDVTENASNGVETHTVRVVYRVAAWSGTLCDEREGTSDLARWHPLARLPQDVMPFVVTAIGDLPDS